MSSKGRILAVDDHPVNTMVLVELLENDYNLQTADNGHKALTAALSLLPDIVLLDIMMPGIDGYETCRRMRREKSLYNTKIIMISARNSTRERLDAYECGADDYLCKPFDPMELKAKIEVYMKLKSTEEIDRLKTDLLGHLTHEIHAPLHTILPPVEMLLADTSLNLQQRELLEMVKSGATALNELFDKTRLLLSIKNGNWNYSFADTAVRPLIEACCHELSRAAGQRNISFAVDVNTAVHADLNTLSIALHAILDNAVKYSPPESRIDIQSQNDSQQVLLSVTNSAIITDQFLPFIFDEFSDPDVSSHAEGHGLSLALVRHIMKAHGGEIRAERCRQGQGIRFTLSFPLNNREVP